MEFYIDRLKLRAQGLSNHYSKYVSLIDKHIDALMGRLEQAGMIERVHLWASAHDYKKEMNIIREVGTSLKEKLDDLSCYFAYQFLQTNLSALDALLLDLTTNRPRYEVYKEFMLRVGHEFRDLTSAYMGQLLKLYLPPDSDIEYVFMGVGTRSDQDDIDVGVVDRGPEGREVLNRAIGRMSMEMFKKAISLHFHLSEHVGSAESYSASIEEYQEMLDKEIHDFVIITELLGAARILGSRRLYSDFRRKVIFRYYYDNTDGKYLKFHEGYLRGIIGETRSFMLRELSKDRIYPKQDGLRMIKGGLFAAKTIFNLRQVNAWAILDELEKRDRRRKSYYERLQQPLTFMEIFRYLYQLFIAQEEEIILTDKRTVDNLAVVAEAMGYRDVGAAKATDFLISDYYKNVLQAKEVVRELLPYSQRHLSSITIFGKLLRHKKATEEGKKRVGNLAIRFLEESKFFRGTRFWDDIISVLASKDGQILKRLINDICSLPEDQRTKVLNQFIEWSWNSFIATFSFMILLYRHRRVLPHCQLFQTFNYFFFTRLQGTAEIAQRLSIVFKNYPQLLLEYIQILNEDQQRTFYQWLDRKLWDEEVQPARDRLRFFLKLHYSTSKYFKRILYKVLNRYPEYINYIDDTSRLRVIGKGLLAEVERAHGTQRKLARLRNYHNFEFFRVCLNTLSGASASTIAIEFTEFSDTYLRMLFDICKQAVDEKMNHQLQTRDLLGILVTGGHGQMLAFDDDYDMIILLNSDDEEILNYATAIVSKMHREIVKCGIMPHYRLADYTGSYICTFSQLKEILSDSYEHKFIDLAQLLIARMIVGSTLLQRVYESEIIKTFIFDQKEKYISSMLNEMNDRREKYMECCREAVDLKEAPGGIRDIEMLLSIFRAINEWFEISNYKLSELLKKTYPSMAREFELLFENYQFLRKIRNLNRLTIAADDKLNKKYISHLAENLQIESKSEASPSEVLLEDVEKSMKLVQDLVDNIVQREVLPILKRQA